MKYGKLEQVDDVNFIIPADHEKSTKFSVSGELPDLFIGGTMWNIPEWVGKIYPAGARKADYIKYYCTQFTTIELNATHYRTPTRETVKKWAAQAPDGFRFCPKFPQSISHYRRFVNCEEQTNEFLLAIHEFAEKLGPSFIQLPPNYSPEKSELLLAYLKGLPSDMQFAIEFRHEGWFGNHSGAMKIWDYLHAKGISAVLSDTAGRRDAVHMHLTASFFILRFGGNNLHASDEQRLSDWAERFVQWKALGLKEFYMLMHQTNSIVTPESCVLFAEAVYQKTGRRVKVPEIIAPTLF